MSPDQIRITIAEHCGIPVCPSCLNRIDPDCCHCGAPTEGHGYQDGHSSVPMGCLCGYDRQPQPKWQGVPDYPGDQNKAIKLVSTLNRHHRRCYLAHIMTATGIYPWAKTLDNAATRLAFVNLMNATALQRCEAFLRTIGKWKEDA